MNRSGEEPQSIGQETCRKVLQESSSSTSFQMKFPFDPSSLTHENQSKNNAAMDDEYKTTSVLSFVPTMKEQCGDVNNNKYKNNTGQITREELAGHTIQHLLTHEYSTATMNQPAIESIFKPLTTSSVQQKDVIANKISKRKSSQKEDEHEFNIRNEHSFGYLPLNNNNEEWIEKSEADPKDAYVGDYYRHVLLYGSNIQNWKRERRYYNFGDYKDYPMRCPWKRIIYVGVLLVIGFACIILALMEVLGTSEKMNIGRFAVMVMGAVMLLPPGLYYGSILFCIFFNFKDYTVWDVPAGPFD